MEKFVKFGRLTTFHGFFDLIQETNRVRRLVWTAVILVSFASVIFYSWRIFQNYRESPVMTVIGIQPQNPMPFPPIEICTSAIFNKTKLEANKSFKADAAATFYTIRSDAVHMVYEKPDILLEQANQGDWVDQEAVSMDFGFELDELLVACQYDWRPVNCSALFKPVFDPWYGKCFLLHDPPSQTEEALGGLNILVDIHSELTWSQAPPAHEGVLLSIQDQFNPLSSKRLFISPGFTTRIALKATQYQLASHASFEGCRRDMERTTINLPYSPSMCNWECYASLAIKHCNCSFVIPKDLKLSDFPFCQSPEEILCVDNVKLSKEFKNCKAKCLPPCEYTDYETTMTTMKFPSAEFVKFMAKKPVEGRQAFGLDWAKRQDKLLLIKLIYDALQVTKVEQKPALGIDGFLSQIGGQMGLFLGASLMSIAQLIFFIFDNCFNIHNWKRTSGQETSSSLKKAWSSIKSENSLSESIHHASAPTGRKPQAVSVNQPSMEGYNTPITQLSSVEN